jgi:hypothetical protein
MQKALISRFLLITAVFASFSPDRAHAYSHFFSPSLPAEALSETSPFAFSPADFEAEDFSITWEGTPIPDVAIHIGKDSLEWVRTGEVFLIPRGRLYVEVRGLNESAPAAGQLRNLGFIQPLLAENGILRGEIPLALTGPETGNRVEILINRNGREEKGVAVVRFAPRVPNKAASDLDDRIVTDSGCSSVGGRPESDSSLGEHQWVYAGCRYIMAWGEEYSVAGLDLFVYWEGAVGKVRVDGVETPASQPGVWMIRLRARPGRVVLEDDAGHRVALRYRIPERQRYGSLGFGLGPYSYTYLDGAATTQSITPLLTIYGSLFFSEIFRMVAFNATSFNKNWFTDTGVYFQTDNFKVLDKRLQMKLLFGAQTLAFNTNTGPRTVFGAPQGFELIFKDFLGKGRTLTGGAFIYPLIEGKKYYNAWIRWGSPRLFGEFNYIDWQEPHGSNFVSSSSIGLTVGAPLIQFF